MKWKGRSGDKEGRKRQRRKKLFIFRKWDY
jgi:hypothetical protein